MSSPFNHEWLSGIFGDEEMVSVLSADAELKRMLKVEAAWTRAFGAIQQEPDANKIAEKILASKIQPKDLYSGTAQDGLAVPTLVHIIKADMNEREAALVHVGLTSQDVIDTALVLTLREISNIIEERLETLNIELDTLHGKVEGNTLMAYTRMQPALPTTAEAVVKTWQKPLPKLLADLKLSTENISMIQYGGPIGNRPHKKSENLGAAFAKNLGLKDPESAWHTDRTQLNEFATLLARITGALGKIGADVAHFAALGAGHVSLEGGGKSSAMPHKNNPVEAEILDTLASYSATQIGGFHHAIVHEHHRSGKAWSLEWMLLPGLIMACGRSVALATSVVRSIKSIGT